MYLIDMLNFFDFKNFKKNWNIVWANFHLKEVRTRLCIGYIVYELEYFCLTALALAFVYFSMDIIPPVWQLVVVFLVSSFFSFDNALEYIVTEIIEKKKE